MKREIPVLRLVLLALGVGIVLTGAAELLFGSTDFSAPTWLGTVATVGALVVALGIYRLQRVQSEATHQELLEKNQELLDPMEGLAESTPASTTPTIDDQERDAIADRYPDNPVAEAWPRWPGRPNAPRLVRLRDGQLVNVYRDSRSAQAKVREIAPRGRGRGPRASR